MEALAAANALAALTGNRHQAAWSLAGVDLDSPLFLESPIQEATPILRVPTEGQSISADYMSVGLTCRRHPVALLRERFQRRQIQSARELDALETQTHVRIAGLVPVRQSPGTAHNTTFMTLEDETGVMNVIVWGSVAEKYWRPFLQAQLLEVGGQLQHEKGLMHVIAEDLIDRSAWLGSLRAPARDFSSVSIIDRFVSNKSVMVAIAGTGSIAHLEENTAAGDVVLTEEDLADLA